MLRKVRFQEEMYPAIRGAFFRLLARLLIAGCLLAGIRPAIPVIADRIAHRYHAAAHFRLVHAHGGADHVHESIQKSVKEGQGSGTQTVKFVLQDWSCAPELSFTVLRHFLPADKHPLFAVRETASSFDKGPDAPPPWG